MCSKGDQRWWWVHGSEKRAITVQDIIAIIIMCVYHHEISPLVHKRGTQSSMTLSLISHVDFDKPLHGVWKSEKKVSFNIASEASYVYIWVDKSSLKMTKNGQFWRVFEKTEAFGQIVLPDRSILKGRKVLLFSLLEFVYLLKTAQQSKKRIIEVRYSKREH